MTKPGIPLAPKMGAQHDEELAQRLQRREPQAMADLYDRFGGLAYSVILAIVRDAAVAEDLVQETFLRAWNRVHTFDAGRGALGPWLLAVARNRAIGHIRSTGGLISPNACEPEVREHASMFSGVERDVLSTDRAQLVRNSLAKLSENQRKAIELAYYEGLSQTEMAERLGERPDTVATWVRTALKHLRDEPGQGVSA